MLSVVGRSEADGETEDAMDECCGCWRSCFFVHTVHVFGIMSLVLTLYQTIFITALIARETEEVGNPWNLISIISFFTLFALTLRSIAAINWMRTFKEYDAESFKATKQFGIASIFGLVCLGGLTAVESRRALLPSLVTDLIFCVSAVICTGLYLIRCARRAKLRRDST